MTRISVIMPVFLDQFDGAANDRQTKFVRAVNSFLKQQHVDKELIIISDGCPLTVEICEQRYAKAMKAGFIKLIPRAPHEGFVGAVRQAGIDIATGDILCNLDSDDSMTLNHLSNISATFAPARVDWVYFNYYRKLDTLKNVEELVLAQPNTTNLCTANVAWKGGLDVTWNGCDGRQDNKAFNQQLIDKYPNRKKIYGCGYIVHHAIILGTNSPQTPQTV